MPVKFDQSSVLRATRKLVKDNKTRLDFRFHHTFFALIAKTCWLCIYQANRKLLSPVSTLNMWLNLMPEDIIHIDNLSLTLPLHIKVLTLPGLDLTRAPRESLLFDLTSRPRFLLSLKHLWIID